MIDKDMFEGIRVVELAQWVFVPVAGALFAAPVFFLAAVDFVAVESLRELFEVDQGRNGLKVEMGMGLSDRSQATYVVFDVDGTVCAVRQRSLADKADKQRPPRRRSDLSCAPGYKG